MKKINGKNILIIVIWLLVIGLLVYSRFINLGWGLPYPMHPDERNMANAIQSLNCNIKDCFNPHFFAYGQFPLYLGYLLVWAVRGFRDFGKIIINFEEAVMSLRVISAMASVINAIIIIKIINIINKKNSYLLSFISYLLIIFSPFFIQFSHFGTTESLLMLFYSLIVYFSTRLLERRTTSKVVWLALVSGLAIATKVSSIIFIAVPLIATLSSLRSWDRYKNLIKFGLLTTIFMILFSPHNLINFRDFFSSIKYESDVALGRVLVFYTRQFFNTIPIWFQLTKVFPYALGWPVLILGGLGFLGGLGWKDRKINLLRFAVLVYLIPSAFLYAKWTRFMTPIFPLMIVFAVLFLLKIKVINAIKIIIVIIAILPGLAYLSIYQNPDVRFQASEWIYKNIPNNSYILSETANVVDIPISNGTMEQWNNYNVISFNFYDLDESPELQLELKNHLRKADYIFVPSRRIFTNHSKQKYPMLNQYYTDLFNGELGFEKVAEFSVGLNDENSEETWTVFDHPLIRIYKRVKSF
ncbi:glycosyltransferase family 39 protein [Candidatus Roizmanbacteria bacterium]|nr:glycosyltransferase family 39 protein [Candidatus Roizmanbacteria bacterium]